MISKVPRNVNLVKEDMVRVFIETEKCYSGPYPVERIDGSQLFKLVKDHEAQHNLDQVMPAAEYDRLVNGDKPMNILLTATNVIRSNKPNASSKRSDVFIIEFLLPLDLRNHSNDA